MLQWGFFRSTRSLTISDRPRPSMPYRMASEVPGAAEQAAAATVQKRIGGIARAVSQHGAGLRTLPA